MIPPLKTNPIEPLCHTSIKTREIGSALSAAPIFLNERVKLRCCVIWLRALGLLLIAAAISKWLTATTDVFIDLDLIDGLQIGVEIIVGVWIVSTPRLKLARWVTIGVYTLLAGAAFYTLLVNTDDCGCFGRWSPPTWVMLTTDCVAIAGLAVLTPSTNLRTEQEHTDAQ